MKIIDDKVKVTFSSPGSDDKVIEGPVSYPVYETADDILELLQKDAKSVISDLNYAANMQARAKVRADIKAEHEGPGKKLAKLVKNFIEAMAALNKTVTEDQAIAQLKSIGAFNE